MKEKLLNAPQSKLVLGKATPVYQGPFITVSKVPFKKRKKGKEGVWEVVTRTNSHGPTVAIVGVTPDLNVVLVREYRIPLKRWVISFCCGAINEDEQDFDAARRELREETGYVVPERKITRLFEGPFSPALGPDSMAVFAGFNAVYEGINFRDHAEDIETITLPLASAMDELLEVSHKVAVDVKVYGALARISRILARKSLLE